MKEKKVRWTKNPLLLLAVLAVLVFLLYFGTTCQTENEEAFRFLFVADLHIKPDEDSANQMTHAVEQINGLEPLPDFVIMGGDLVENWYIRDYGSASQLYDLYQEICAQLNMPVYSVLGNNDIVPAFEGSPAGESQVLDGKDMFRNRLGNGKTYYSFNHKGWHFVLLDSIEKGEDDSYRGIIDEVQMEWLSDDLEKLEKDRPVCVALHIPLATIFMQTHINSTIAPRKFAIVNNGTEVIKLLAPYNVKLVLQGHLHIVEELNYQDTTYISGGSISRAQKNPSFVHDEGFVIVDVHGNDFTWNYYTLADRTY
jgi:3',5'-cyclic AMP phosphodiesterase CpdA